MKTLEKMIRRVQPTLVVFYRRGDADLSKMQSLIAQLKQEVGDKLEVLEYDCTENGQPKEKYRFQEYPTYILFADGGELMRLSGDTTAASLLDMAKRAM